MQIQYFVPTAVLLYSLAFAAGSGVKDDWQPLAGLAATIVMVVLFLVPASLCVRRDSFEVRWLGLVREFRFVEVLRIECVSSTRAEGISVAMASGRTTVIPVRVKWPLNESGAEEERDKVADLLTEAWRERGRKTEPSAPGSDH